VKGLKLQIERNLDNLQVLMMDHDSQIFELCKKIFEVVGIYGNEQQKEAAYFLIEQLPLIQEERREIVLENEQFHLSNQETIHEIEKVKGDIDRLKNFVDNNIDLETAGQTEILEYLKERLDRVHERVEAEKNGEKVSVLSELRGQIERTEAGLHRETHRKQHLRTQLLE
jgi:hypothetical protein